METQENRKQILQQRQDEREYWEAEQVVLRAEQQQSVQLFMGGERSVFILN